MYYTLLSGPSVSKVRGGEVLRIHRGIGEIVPVEVQRPKLRIARTH